MQVDTSTPGTLLPLTRAPSLPPSPLVASSSPSSIGRSLLLSCFGPSRQGRLGTAFRASLTLVLPPTAAHPLTRTPFSLQPGACRCWQRRTAAQGKYPTCTSNFCWRDKVTGNGVCARLMWPQSTLKGRKLSFHAKGRAIAGGLAGTSRQLIEQQFRPL